MFKNRSLKVSIEKNPTPTSPNPARRMNRDDIEATIDLAKKHVRDLAVGGVGIYAAVKVISTASEIAINIAPKR